jgi:hypothetical protein
MLQISYEILHENHSKKELIVSLYLVWAIFLLRWFNVLTFAVMVPSCLVLPLNLRIFPFSFWG